MSRMVSWWCLIWTEHEIIGGLVPGNMPLCWTCVGVPFGMTKWPSGLILFSDGNVSVGPHRFPCSCLFQIGCQYLLPVSLGKRGMASPESYSAKNAAQICSGTGFGTSKRLLTATFYGTSMWVYPVTSMRSPFWIVKIAIESVCSHSQEHVGMPYMKTSWQATPREKWTVGLHCTVRTCEICL